MLSKVVETTYVEEGHDAILPLDQILGRPAQRTELGRERRQAALTVLGRELLKN
jgi:hypothetical protein